MKNGEIKPYFNFFNSMLNIEAKENLTRFFAACSQNKRKLKTALELMEEEQKGLPHFSDYQEWEKEREEIVRKYAKKDEQGQYIEIQTPQGGQYDITPEDIKKADEEIVELAKDKKYKTAIDEYNEYLSKENTEYVLYMMDLDSLPSSLSGQQVEILQDFIK